MGSLSRRPLVARGVRPNGLGKRVTQWAASLGDEAWGESMSAMVPKARWWSTSSNDAGSPEPIDVSKATRSCW